MLWRAQPQLRKTKKDDVQDLIKKRYPSFHHRIIPTLAPGGTRPGRQRDPAGVAAPVRPGIGLHQPRPCRSCDAKLFAIAIIQ